MVGKVAYTTVHLNQLFAELKQKSAEFKLKLTAAKHQAIESEVAVDTSLVKLLQKSDELSQKYPKLATELSKFYSALNEQLAKSSLASGRTGLCPEEINAIANQTVTIIGVILSADAPDKGQQFAQYEKMLRQKLPKSKVSYDETRIIDALFVLGISIMLSMFIETISQKSASLEFPSLALGGLISLLGSSCRQMSMAAGGGLAVYTVFSKSKLVSVAEEMLESLHTLAQRSARR